MIIVDLLSIVLGFTAGYLITTNFVPVAYWWLGGIITAYAISILELILDGGEE